jgi:hypothetical protein
MDSVRPRRDRRTVYRVSKSREGFGRMACRPARYGWLEQVTPSLWRIEPSRRKRLDQAVLRRLRKREGHGRYWARTSDPQLVELVLSQLS